MHVYTRYGGRFVLDVRLIFRRPLTFIMQITTSETVIVKFVCTRDWMNYFSNLATSFDWIQYCSKRQTRYNMPISKVRGKDMRAQIDGTTYDFECGRSSSMIKIMFSWLTVR